MLGMLINIELTELIDGLCFYIYIYFCSDVLFSSEALLADLIKDFISSLPNLRTLSLLYVSFNKPFSFLGCLMHRLPLFCLRMLLLLRPRRLLANFSIISRHCELKYQDARFSDTAELTPTDTDQSVALSSSGLTRFSGSRKWLDRLPNRSHHTLSELVLVDKDVNWTKDCLKSLVTDLHRFNGWKSLHVQAGSGALNNRLSPANAMALISAKLPWLKELTLCYYDHYPCFSFVMVVSFSSRACVCQNAYH